MGMATQCSVGCGHTTPSDFRKNLRKHGGPQARPREKAGRECEWEPQLKISLRLPACGARTCHFPSKSAVF